MDNVISFQALRNEKQKQLSSFVIEHSKAMNDYVARYVNIREKVKAKHIFSGKVGSNPPPFSFLEEQLFLDWFTFDYRTIKGKTIYQSYIEKQENGKNHPLDVVIHALFMASVLEPFKVMKMTDRHIYAEKILTGELCKIQTMSMNDEHIQDYIFLRTVPIYDQLLCISEVFSQREEEINQLRKHFEQSSLSWRTFLKRFAIKYSWKDPVSDT